jgi:hypothetical protein
MFYVFLVSFFNKQTSHARHAQSRARAHTQKYYQLFLSQHMSQRKQR